MADSTLRLTFSELRIRVADYLGLATIAAGSAAALPTDVHDLDLVGRIVNDAYRRFLTDSNRWNFLTVPLSVTFGTNMVAADKSRYFLPDDFYGLLLSPFTYASNGLGVSIRQVNEATIRQYVSGGGDSTGDPVVFAIRPINVDATATAQRWEAIFWPTPDGTEAVTAVYKRFPNKLSANGDVSVAGFQHDQTVLQACLAAAELQRGDAMGPHEKMYQTRLDMSKSIDRRAAPASLGGYGDRSEDGPYPRRFELTTYNGNPI